MSFFTQYELALSSPLLNTRVLSGIAF